MTVLSASAKNQADFFHGITTAARQTSSAIDLPYMLMYQTQLSEGEHITERALPL